jgi:hypothetical protein
MTRPGFAPFNVKTGPLKPTQVKPSASLSEVQGLTGARQAWPTFSETSSWFSRAFQKGKCKWMGQAPAVTSQETNTQNKPRAALAVLAEVTGMLQ